MYYDSEVFPSLSLALLGHQRSLMVLVIFKRVTKCWFLFSTISFNPSCNLSRKLFFFAFEMGIWMTNTVHLPLALQKETEYLGFRHRIIHTYGQILTHSGQTEEK